MRSKKWENGFYMNYQCEPSKFYFLIDMKTNYGQLSVDMKKGFSTIILKHYKSQIEKYTLTEKCNLLWKSCFFVWSDIKKKKVYSIMKALILGGNPICAYG